MSGLIILPVFIIYLSVSFIVLKMLFKQLFPKMSNLKSKLIVLAIVFFLPYLDLFLQKSIQLYYNQTDFTKAVAYHYPFNENGKLESYNLIDFSLLKEKKLLNKEHYNYEKILVEDFVELQLENNKLVRLDLHQYSFEYIDKPIARYKLINKNNLNGCFGFCEKHSMQLIDTQTNILMGEIKSIYFDSKYAYFREKILMQMVGTGHRLFGVRAVYARSPISAKQRLMTVLKESVANE